MISGDAKITSINSESTSMKEGTILYDVRFKAIVPGSTEPIGLIINIEIQNDDRPGKSILNPDFRFSSPISSALTKKKGNEIKVQEF